MINSIGSIDGYANVFGDNINVNAVSRDQDKQNVNDVVSINSANILDNEIGNVFNNVMSDLNITNSDLGDLHGGLNLDRVKALLSL